MQKIVLITGASSGIGRVTAYFLAKNGFVVYAGSRTPEKLDSSLPNLFPIALDLSDEKQIKNSIENIYRKENRLDVVINNAGYGLVSSVEDATEEQMLKQFDINVFAIFRVCKHSIPYLKKNDESVIINLSSYFGKISIPLMSFYCASKFAVDGLSDALRYELKDTSIRVHTLMPGATKTNFTKNNLIITKGTSKLTDKIFENINNGSHPLMVAEEILKVIHNKDSKTKKYVGVDTNKILSMREALQDDDFDNRIIGEESLIWDSIFYNASENYFNRKEIEKSPNSYISKIDISNGIVSLDMYLLDHRKRELSIDNRDKMITIIIVKDGELSINDRENQEHFLLASGHVYLFTSSRQNISLVLEKSKKSEIYVLAIADFILKRYLSKDESEPINYLYAKTKIPKLECISELPLDALTLYLLNRIKDSYTKITMQSILGEHRTIELMLHRFSLLDVDCQKVDSEILSIALDAKNILLKDFINAPKIDALAHLCSTNKTKLQQAFKLIYKMTIPEYIKKLRLEKANILLREQSLTIGEISKAVGYQHQGNFSKLFFERYHVYPKEILKQNC